MHLCILSAKEDSDDYKKLVRGWVIGKFGFLSLISIITFCLVLVFSSVDCRFLCEGAAARIKGKDTCYSSKWEV